MIRKKLEMMMGVIIMAIVSLIIVTADAVADDKDMLREIQDREQINKLMWDYARALDTGNVEAYVATFTEDGQFGRGDNAIKGREALRKMLEGFRKSSTVGQAKIQRTGALYHMTANHIIEFSDKDHAIFQGYWLAFVAGSGKNAQPTIVGVGREVNELVRVNGKWLIQVRDIVPRD